MKKPRLRVLGIDPGTKYLGTALLEHHELVHHAVFDVLASSPQRTLTQVRRVVLRLIEAYQPHTLAVERTFFHKGRHAGLLRTVTDEILELGLLQGLQVQTIAPSSVKKAVTGDGHASKREVAKAVCQGFPHLRAFLGCNRLWKERYHSNMFDAIAVAAVASNTHAAGGNDV